MPDVTGHKALPGHDSGIPGRAFGPKRPGLTALGGTADGEISQVEMVLRRAGGPGIGVSVNGGHVPGKKKARLAAHGRAWWWNLAISRRLAMPGITAALLGVAACSSAGPSGAAGKRA